MSEAFLTDPARPCAHPDISHLFTSDEKHETNRAKPICGGCPFRTDCLAYAVENDETFHVWGGYLMSSVGERAAAIRKHYGPTREQVRHLRERGKSDTEIARILGLEKSTVREHRIRLGLPALPKPGRPRLRVAA